MPATLATPKVANCRTTEKEWQDYLLSLVDEENSAYQRSVAVTAAFDKWFDHNDKSEPAMAMLRLCRKAKADHSKAARNFDRAVNEYIEWCGNNGQSSS